MLAPRAFPATAVALAAVLATLGCAPLAAYRGPVPAPGALTGFTGASPGGGVARDDAAGESGVEPRGADPARHRLGALPIPAGRESLVVLVYGDNRPGYRLQTRAVEFGAVRGLASASPARWLRGLAFLPVFLIEAVVPALDGPRDAVARVTRRPAGGRERAVLRALERRLPADLVVSAGDLVHDGRRGRQWEDFVARHADLRRSALYVAAPGNHERTASALARANWSAAMGEPARPGRLWLSLDVPEAGARFVFLDSNVLADPEDEYPDSLEEALSREQLAWADSTLAAPARRRFVVLHHPLVGSGYPRADWRSARAAERRARLLAMCAERRVTAVFCGHEHLYQRVYVRAAGGGGGFWHVTTGGAGSPLYWVSRAAWREAMARPLPAGLALDPGSARIEREHHFCRLTLPRAGGAAPLVVERVRRDARTARLDTLDLAAPPP